MKIRFALMLSTLAVSGSLHADFQYGITVEPYDLAYMFTQHSRGVAYELGRGGPPDYRRAVDAYRRAAVLGFPLAQNNLGRLYEVGHGVAQNYVLAYVWYTLAAANGDEIARADREASAQRLTRQQLGRAQKIASRLSGQLP